MSSEGVRSEPARTGAATIDRDLDIDEVVDLTALELEDTLQLDGLPKALLGSYLIG